MEPETTTLDAEIRARLLEAAESDPRGGGPARAALERIQGREIRLRDLGYIRQALGIPIERLLEGATGEKVM